MLFPGDLVPSLVARTVKNPAFSLDSVAGRYIVMSFVGGSHIAGATTFHQNLHRADMPFDDTFASVFVVTNNPQDIEDGPLTPRFPGIRVFHDLDFNLATTFGGTDPGGNPGKVRMGSWIVDPGMRILKFIAVSDLATHHEAVRAALQGLRPPSELVDSWAPVISVPNVFEPDFCGELLDYAQANGMTDSGYMRTDPATGQTVLVVDHGHKRRMDCTIADAPLREAVRARINRRLVPQIERAFQFKATRMERYLISCYEADTEGHFRAHKDNTTKGTAHRRFAVSIGLNADEYEGGDLAFPEFGTRRYRPTTGGAIVFSCSLLHEVSPVTKGRRYAVLPFLYDEEAAKVRIANAEHLEDPELRATVMRSVAQA